MPIENQTIRDYLLQKQKEREELKAKLDSDAGGPNIGAALAAIGAGFQGRDSVGAGQAHLERNAKQRQNQLSEFDAGADRYIKDQDAMIGAEKADREKSMLAVEDDVNSEESKIATELAQRMGYKGGPISATKFKAFSPALTKMYEIEQKKIENDLTRQDRRDSKEAAAADRKIKNSELSATQAKQMGLYKMGKTAEEQYLTAVANPEEYDPTEPGQLLDNDTSGWVPAYFKNDNANKAASAQSAWVESFLRDASGAAIPVSERMNYAKDYFPRPGDSKDVVANKAALRQQKMENSLIGGGEMGQQELARRQAPKEPMVQIKAPDGSIRSIPESQKAAALAAGGQLVNSVAGR
jgi:hypothetical protein